MAEHENRDVEWEYSGAAWEKAELRFRQYQLRYAAIKAGKANVEDTIWDRPADQDDRG